MDLEKKIYYSLVSGAFLFNPVAFIIGTVVYKSINKFQNKTLSNDIERLKKDNDYMINKSSEKSESIGMNSSEYKKKLKEAEYRHIDRVKKYKPIEKLGSLMFYGAFLLPTQWYNHTNQAENVYENENISVYQRNEFEPSIAKYSLFGKIFKKEVSHSLLVKDLKSKSICYISPTEESRNLIDKLSFIQRCDVEIKIPESLIKSK